MPTYRVRVTYSEILYYSGETEIEAEDQEDAERQALENPYDFCDSHDSDYHDSPQIDDIECISRDEEEEEEPKQGERNLPEWF